MLNKKLLIHMYIYIFYRDRRKREREREREKYIGIDYTRFQFLN
jgi:hypothetical protein